MSHPTLAAAEDGRWSLRIERHYSHPISAVWSAITEPATLAQWFPFRVDWSPAVGAPITFTEHGPGDEPPLHGVVTDYDPPFLLAFDWEDEHLRFELSGVDGGCRLLFVHLFHDRHGAASFGAGWETCFAGLGQVLSGARPTDHVDMTRRHEELVDLLDLDDPEVITTNDAVTVRVTRQLVAPCEVAWRHLVGDGPASIGAPPPTGVVVNGLAAGPMTSVDPDGRLSYDASDSASPGARIDWTLSDDQGTGQGARLVVTWSARPGASPEVVERAGTALSRRIREYARSLVSAAVGSSGKD